MSVNGHCFVEWKEQFVSQERGNRVVHYFLKDSAGECILAVVGTERSLRHMSYVVAEEFVQVCGTEHSVRSGFKWRSRREVVDWLTSRLSKNNYLQDQHRSLNHDASQGLNSSERLVKRSGAVDTQILDNMGCHARNLDCTPDIVWLGDSWTCGKRLKHYHAFCRNGTTIMVQSFVLVMAKEESHYVAYLEDMYEDKKGQKKVKVRWFHHIEEVRGVIPLRHCHPKEVFITPYVQVISAECVDGPTTVLTREHYNHCSTVFPDALVAKIYLCCRQFKNSKMKSFELSKLHGYFEQPILSSVRANSLPRPHVSVEKYEELSSGDIVKLRSKRPRIGEGSQFLSDQIGMSSLNLFDCQPWYPSQLKIKEKMELLSQDSGIRGCWFRCTILQVSRKHIKVIYDDVQDEDHGGNLEESVPAVKFALPDKLGMRSLGRPTIRPVPPSDGQTDLVIGAAVDAWWNDGWWEGVVIGLDSHVNDTFHIYFTGENLLFNIHKKDLRVSRDWIGGQWIDIKPKPDILAVVSADISLKTKIFMSSTIGKHFNSIGIDMLSDKVSPDSEQRVVDKKTLNTVPSGSCDGLPHIEEQIYDMELNEGTKDSSHNTSGRKDTVGDAQNGIVNTSSGKDSVGDAQDGIVNTSGGKDIEGDVQNGIETTSDGMDVLADVQNGIENASGGKDSLANIQDGIDNTSGGKVIVADVQDDVENMSGGKDIVADAQEGSDHHDEDDKRTSIEAEELQT